VSGLVQQVLALSQSRERFDEPIPVAPVVVAVGELLKRSAPALLDISIEVAPDVGDILGDADGLHHALTRLAVRAVDALRGRSGKVTLRADMPQRGGRPQVRILVSDTGPALSPEACAHLFDPYTPLGQGADLPDRSNRLGLAAVQRIVTEFGGTISVESVPGKGTRFELLFPCVHAASRSPAAVFKVDAMQPAERAERELPPASVGGGGEHRDGRETILLVDDDPAVLEVEREMLESVGYRVIACADPDEALRILTDRDCVITLMLTDLTMPGLDGIELAARAKRIRPGLRIVCCTGYGDGRSERRGLEVGIAAFVHKPIDLDRLASTLRQTIDA
jgi:CheY-like chemotaxis protein